MPSAHVAVVRDGAGGRGGRDSEGASADALQTFDIGPEEELRALPLYHYNRACSEALYGDLPDARHYLKTAVRMDPWFGELARNDPDLAGIRGSGTGRGMRG